MIGQLDRLSDERQRAEAAQHLKSLQERVGTQLQFDVEKRLTDLQRRVVGGWSEFPTTGYKLGKERTQTPWGTVGGPDIPILQEAGWIGGRMQDAAQQGWKEPGTFFSSMLDGYKENWNELITVSDHPPAKWENWGEWAKYGGGKFLKAIVAVLPFLIPASMLFKSGREKAKNLFTSWSGLLVKLPLIGAGILGLKAYLDHKSGKAQRERKEDAAVAPDGRTDAQGRSVAAAYESGKALPDTRANRELFLDETVVPVDKRTVTWLDQNETLLTVAQRYYRMHLSLNDLLPGTGKREWNVSPLVRDVWYVERGLQRRDTPVAEMTLDLPMNDSTMEQLLKDAGVLSKLRPEEREKLMALRLHADVQVPFDQYREGVRKLTDAGTSNRGRELTRAAKLITISCPDRARRAEVIAILERALAGRADAAGARLLQALKPEGVQMSGAMTFKRIELPKEDR